ncbi:cell elongation-specific peptidoglycan biosynthesis regulator RodA [Halospina denitrificans]|uniref:Peptidoglycan glycosyltransferase MrdB n=1 Tax=Halospina denitrificans TaxID=332522 RepID=A0A4R7JLC9_9GAMM|nr:rod shape-determining protein RodA [Halospina denitrificans]TDT37843.1 cell elongation-specific peptidoglycan biosynthesis regulator RodA [Halospina denitrificans]
MSKEFVRQMALDPDHFERRRGVMARMHLDPWLLLLLLGVMGFGLVVLFSASENSAAAVEAQVIRMGVAFVIMLFFAQLDPLLYRRWSPLVYLAGTLALVAVMFFGEESGGAQRWLDIPGVTRVQPSELMKVAVPLMVAWYLSRQHLPPGAMAILVTAVLVVAPSILIANQPDLGTALLVAASGLFVLFLAGLSWKLITTMVILAALSAPAMWLYVMRDYQKERVLTLLNPGSDPLGAGWNITQSKTAIGSGGLYGKGWEESTQASLDFLPESHTDFIVAVLAEEFGFVGVTILLVLYALIVIRGLFIASAAQSSFSRLLAGGITLTFFIYVLVNVSMVSGLVPVVGVPLPLVSFGGTSMVTLMLGFGILMAIHTHRRMLET